MVAMQAAAAAPIAIPAIAPSASGCDCVLLEDSLAPVAAELVPDAVDWLLSALPVVRVRLDMLGLVEDVVAGTHPPSASA